MVLFSEWIDQEQGTAPTSGSSSVSFDLTTARKYIENNEGRRGTTYNDSVGIPTVGIGFNLHRPDARKKIEDLGVSYDDLLNGEAELSDDQINSLAEADINTALEDARSLVPDFDRLSRERQIVIVDMAFNLGRQRLGGFKKALKALNSGDYATAAAEMQDSKWFNQVGRRGRQNVSIMMSNRMPANMQTLVAEADSPENPNSFSGWLNATPGHEGFPRPALKVNPDKEAKARQQAVDLGVDPEAVRAAPDTAEELHRLKSLEGLASEAPVTSRFLSNPKNAAVAHDAAEELGMVEAAGRAFERGRLTHKMGKAAYGLRANRSPEAQGQLDAVKERLIALGQDGEGFVSWIGAASEILGQQFESMGSDEAAIRIGSGAGIGATVGAFGGPLAPATAPAGGAAGAAAGTAYHLALDAFEVEAGLSYVEQVEAGVDPDVAYWTSFGVGVINSGLELLGTTAVLAPFAKTAKALIRKGVKETVTPTIKRAAIRMAQSYGTAVAGETLTEGLQEMVNIAFESVGKYFSDVQDWLPDPEKSVERVGQIIEHTFKGMALLGAPGASVQFATEARQAKQAQKAGETMDAVAESAQASKLAQRDKETAAKHAAEVLTENNISEVHLPVNDVIDALGFDEANAIFERMGVDRMTVDDARLLDGDVRVDNEAYSREILLNPEVYRALGPHVRLDVDGMTPAEAKTFNEQGVQEFEQVQEEAALAADLVAAEPALPKFTAAIRTGNKNEVVTGHTHGEIVDTASEEQRNALLEGEQGFVDEQGQFIDRSEAAKRLSEAEGPNGPVRLQLHTSDFESVRPEDTIFGPVLEADAIRDQAAHEYEQHTNKLIELLGGGEITRAAQRQQRTRELDIAKEEIGLRGLFLTAQEAGMTTKEYQQYLKLLARNAQIAETRQQVRHLQSEQRKLTQEWNAHRNRIAPEAREHVRQQPVYAAVESLQTFGGVHPRLDGAKVKKILQKDPETLKRLPRNKNNVIYTTKKNEPSIDPDVLAELYGFEGGDIMLFAMLDQPSFEQAVQGEIDRRMNTEFGDLRNEREAVDVALEALHNDTTGEVLAFELNQLREATAQKRVRLAHVKAYAKARLDKTQMRDINPRKFVRQERKQARAAGKLLRAGDRQGAAQAKFRQLVNFYMAQEAYSINRKFDKEARFIKQFGNTRKRYKSLPPDYLAAIQTLGHKFGLNRFVRDKEFNILDWQNTKLIEDGVAVDLPNSLLVSDPKSFKDLTLTEWRDLYATVKTLHKTGVQEKQTLDKQKQSDIDAIVAEIAGNVRSNLTVRDISKRTKIRRRLRSGALLGANADTILRELDGFKDLGPAYVNIKGRIDRAITEGYHEGQIGFERRRATEAKALVDLLESSFDKSTRLNMNRETIEIEGVGRRVSHNQVLSVLLNSGNQYNMEAMVEGGPFSETEILAIHEYASKADWDFAQKVWDYLDHFWPEIKSATERRRGITPERVEPYPVETRHGLYRGGYYPVQYDKDQAIIPGQREVEEAIKSTRFGHFVSSHTRHSHTKKRTASGGRPVRLDIATLFSHVNQVVYDIEVGDAVNDGYKILYHPEMKKVFSEMGQVERWEALDLWFGDVITGERVLDDMLNASLRWLRTGFTVSKLGWNIGVAFLQPLGLLQTSVVIGQKAMWKGLYRTTTAMGRGEDPFAFVASQSGFMASREDSFNKDIIAAIRQLNQSYVRKGMARIMPGHSGEATADFIRDSFFFGIKKTQKFVDTVTWLGAYDKGIEQFQGDEGKARAYADNMVSRSQASGLFHQRTAFERGTISPQIRQTELVKMWTALMSYFAAKSNVTYERIRTTNFHKPTEWVKLGSDLVLLYTVEAILASIIRGQWPDDEDDIPLFVAEESINAISAGIPMWREVWNEAQGFRGGGVPGSVFGQAGKVAEQISQGEMDTALFTAANDLGGTLLHYPSSQINKTVRAADEYDATFWEFLMGPKYNR